MIKRLDVGSCFIRSWTLYKSEFGLIFFATLLILVASSAANGFPYIGPVIGLALNGVLYGGLYAFYLKVIRGQKAELTDAFDGFRIATVPLILASVITGTLMVIAMIATGFPMLFTVVPLAIKYAQNPELAPDVLLTAIGAGTILNIIACVIVGLIFYAIWVFTFPLVIDKRMDFWPAMESSRKMVQQNFAPILGLLAAGVGLTILGVLACCIGVFFTIPIFFGAVTYAYEDLFVSDNQQLSTK
jgi:uncharacterized membrane protein